MANYDNIKATINANIKTNGNQEISGSVLNSVLNEIVNTLGAGYQFAGVATTATDPGSPDAKVFYIANGKGTYTNFGGINVTEDEVVVLYWDTEWHKVSTGIASQVKLTELKEKVDALALGAFYGYFPDSASLPTDMTIPGYAYVGLDNPYKIWNFNGESWSDSGTSIDMNDADEEDITRNADGKLQFKDRSYGDGMGYVILRKEKTFEEQLTQANTIYEIRYDFDLGGAEVEIPANCVLKFSGGKVKNGVLIGEMTKIWYNGTILSQVSIRGFWNITNIHDYIFDSDTASVDNSLRNLFALTNPSVQNNVFIDSYDYYISLTDQSNNYIGVSINSNTKVIINKTISLRASTLSLYSIIRINDADNVVIDGSGQIIGDSLIHTGTRGEWGYGIEVAGDSANVTISGLTIKNCWGDSVYINAKGNIDIDNCVLYGSRRQGISVTNGDNIRISNCEISYILGTEPRFAINIEPNSNEVVKNVFIDNITAHHCKGGISIVSVATNAIVCNVVVINCYISNCTRDGISIVGESVNKELNNIAIKNNTIIQDNDTEQSDKYGVRIDPLRDITSYTPSAYNRLSEMVVVENNKIIVEQAISAGVKLYLNCKGVVVRDNTISGASYSIQLQGYDNIIQNNHFVGTVLYENSHNLKFENNIINRIVSDTNSSDVSLIGNFINGSDDILILSSRTLIHNNKITLDSSKSFIMQGNDVVFSNNNVTSAFCYGYYNGTHPSSGAKIFGNIIVGRIEIRQATSFVEFFNNKVIVQQIGCNIYGENINIYCNDFISEGSSSFAYVLGIYETTNATIKDNLIVPKQGDNYCIRFYLGNSKETHKHLKIIDNIIDPSGINDRRCWGSENGVNILALDVYTHSNSYKSFGKTSERPIIDTFLNNYNIQDNGFMYFDTTLNKPIYWTGAKWVDATGADA